MLREIADGVWMHDSECIQSNTVVVQGAEGVLLIDPGLTNAELVCLTDDLRQLGQPVVAGFATHPDWDHVLWHASLGDAPRYGTARCAASLVGVLARPDWEADVAEGLPEEVAGDVPMALFGQITGLPEGADRVPWNGPSVRIIEHNGHSPGHAALLIEQSRVLVAGDMLSDVLVPMLDLHRATEPVADYLAALDLLQGLEADVDIVVPGHGWVGGAGELRARVEQDRAYVEALRDHRESGDPRIGPDAKPGWEWVVYIDEGQRARLA